MRGPRTTRRDTAFPRPMTTVDVAIFSIREERLHVLLVKRPADSGEPFPGRWALPGGFVDIAHDRDLESCALRKLLEKTGVRTPYLEQLGSWGSAKRDPRGWSATHVYFALVSSTGLALATGGNASDAAWIAVRGQGVEPRLAFDHREILGAAITRLRAKVEYTSLPVYLVEEPFTLTDLQRAYEIVLERPVNKAAFRTRLLSAGLVVSTGESRGGKNRPAELFRLAAERVAPVFFPRTFSPRG
jgi:8-oxo-dGTP diphosphatase